MLRNCVEDFEDLFAKVTRPKFRYVDVQKINMNAADTSTVERPKRGCLKGK
jgi:hypothetical protein